jgi:large-conductance mechanosensitive channel
MKKTSFETILSFLLGVSWAFLLLGAILIFQYFLDFGIASAVFSTIAFIFVSLFFILLLEAINLYRDGHEEKIRQTKLLLEIRDLLKKTEDD